MPTVYRYSNLSFSGQVRGLPNRPLECALWGSHVQYYTWVGSDNIRLGWNCFSGSHISLYFRSINDEEKKLCNDWLQISAAEVRELLEQVEEAEKKELVRNLSINQASRNLKNQIDFSFMLQGWYSQHFIYLNLWIGSSGQSVYLWQAIAAWCNEIFQLIGQVQKLWKNEVLWTRALNTINYKNDNCSNKIWHDEFKMIKSGVFNNKR